MSTAFSEALRPLAAQMPRLAREHEVLRVVGNVPSNHAPEESAKKIIREVLRWARNRIGKAFPQEAWEGKSFDLPLPGRDPSAIRLNIEPSHLWAFRLQDPDKNVPQRTWATEVVLGYMGRMPSDPLRFSARLLVATPEEDLSIDPAVPGFVVQIAENCGLMVGTQAARSTPVVHTNKEDAENLIEHLIDDNRQLPTIALTVKEDASEPLMDANELARALTGLAHVAVIHPEASWVLTKRLGKRLSVFGGAARLYLPDFDCSADPFEHRLVLSDQLASPEGIKRASRWLREFVAQASLRRTRLGKDVLTFSTLRTAKLKSQQLQIQKANSRETDQLGISLKRIKELEEQIKKLYDEQEYYIEEFERERERAEIAESQGQKAAFRIQHLTDRLKAAQNDPDEGIVLPEDWAGIANWCDEELAGRVVLTSKARRGIRNPKFKDIETAAKCLLWLASEGRDRFRKGGGSVTNATISHGIRNAPCGADAFEFDWGGRRFSADWHIKKGGNTRDPSRCLRIYYCFDPQTQQIIVADMPAHRRTGAT